GRGRAQPLRSRPGPGYMQVPVARQAPLAQSVSAMHVLPDAQGGHAPPPQSTSVSVPSFMPSAQVAAPQLPFARQVPVAQSDATLHCTHIPAFAPDGAPQTVPPFAVQGPAIGARTGVPIAQLSAMQGLMSSGTSVSSSIERVPPLPSHTTSMQSPGVWLAVGVMEATSCVPQQPPTQVASTHSFMVG